jgi:oligoendopeptidase F
MLKFTPAFTLLISLTAFAANPKIRSSVPVEYTWNLGAIYANETDWRADMEKIKTQIPDLTACRGHLGDSPDKLKSCLELSFSMSQRMSRINTWAELKKADDLKSAQNMEFGELARDLASKVQEAESYFSPEITALGRDQVEKMEKRNEALKAYHQFLRVTLDQTDHILDIPREELLASLGPILNNSGEIHGLLMTSDIAWKSVKLSDGKSYSVDQTVYEKFRESSNRADRLKVFQAFYQVLSQYQRTFGATLGAAVKRNVILAHTRKYPNALTAALDRDKLPEEVYRQLVAQVNAGLPVFHSYLKLQQKRLGVKKLEYADVYAPVGTYVQKFPIAVAEKIVLEALKPLGTDYQLKISSAFKERWADVYPREGKESGGFMNPGAFPTHPFLLLNHQDNFSSTSTLAHEFGHAMHSVYSSSAQPYQYSDYATFIAEIASITNEVLLHEYMIKNSKSRAEKLYFNDELLKMIRTTFFRQTQFAEFELKAHEEIEHGKALSGQRLTEMYGDILQRYYGQKEGAMNIDSRYFSEWEFIPHFYGGFYVFQYATSMAAAFYFAENILAGKPGALDQYLTVLKAGSSKYPYEILMEAGVDMKSPAVYQAVVERMKSAVADMSEVAVQSRK